MAVTTLPRTHSRRASVEAASLPPLVLVAALIMQHEWRRLTATQGLAWQIGGWIYVLLPCLALLWLRTRGVSLRSRARLACNLLPVALGLQIALGISTLLLVVPLPLAAAHQAGALLLFTVAIWTASELR